MSAPPSWLPNLVRGVSIWKLGANLNAERFMAGRLLEPETEGSDSLPARVTWDVTGKLPLAAAREKHPAAVEQAIAELFAALERVREALDDETSGYHHFREAFTIPALDVEGGAHYFFDVDDGKLYVANWGASPRTMRQEQRFLFGYDSFGDLYDREGIAPAGSAAGGPGGRSGTAPTGDSAEVVAGALAPPEAARAAEANAADAKAGEKRKEESKTTTGRPWWHYALGALAALAAAVAAVLLVERCGADAARHAGGDAGASGGGGAAAQARAADAAALGAVGGSGGKGGNGGDGGGGDGGAGGEGGEGAGGEGAGSAADAGAGEADGGPGDPDDAGSGSLPGSGEMGGVVVVVPGVGVGGPPVLVKPGQVHRAHDHPSAIGWRVRSGFEHVERVDARGSTYHVFLRPGSTFEHVQIEWQDRGGKWHAH